MNYNKLKFTKNQIAVANIDKLSFHKRGSRRTYTQFGIVTLYGHMKGNTRLFSIRKSKYLHNGGSYTKTSLRKRILQVKI